MNTSNETLKELIKQTEGCWGYQQKEVCTIKTPGQKDFHVVIAISQPYYLRHCVHLYYKMFKDIKSYKLSTPLIGESSEGAISFMNNLKSEIEQKIYKNLKHQDFYSMEERELKSTDCDIGDLIVCDGVIGIYIPDDEPTVVTLNKSTFRLNFKDLQKISNNPGEYLNKKISFEKFINSYAVVYRMGFQFDLIKDMIEKIDLFFSKKEQGLGAGQPKSGLITRFIYPI